MRTIARAGICGLIAAVGILAQLSAQESAPKPKKVLTPEQQEFQANHKAYMAQRKVLIDQANKGFDAEMAHEKSGACKGADGTYGFETCYEKEGKITETNYKAFTSAIREMLGLVEPEISQEPISGPTGAPLTAGERVKQFDAQEFAWQQYRKAGTDAASGVFKGGTEAPVFRDEADFMLVRSHMRELNFIYDFDLHH